MAPQTAWPAPWAWPTCAACAPGLDALAEGGFAQYEISNYARSDSGSYSARESQHNRAYWLGADYLGFGPGAFSTVGFSRWENVRDTAAYTRGILGGALADRFGRRSIILFGLIFSALS